MDCLEDVAGLADEEGAGMAATAAQILSVMGWTARASVTEQPVAVPILGIVLAIVR